MASRGSSGSSSASFLSQRISIINTKATKAPATKESDRRRSLSSVMRRVTTLASSSAPSSSEESSSPSSSAGSPGWKGSVSWKPGSGSTGRGGGVDRACAWSSSWAKEEKSTRPVGTVAGVVLPPLPVVPVAPPPLVAPPVVAGLSPSFPGAVVDGGVFTSAPTALDASEGMRSVAVAPRRTANTR